MPTDAVAAAREALGRQLRDLRISAHLTQQELANLLGYSRPRVAGAEKGESCALLFWQGCDKVLHANGALLAHYREVEALRQQEMEEAAAAARAERAARVRESGGHLAVASPANLIARDEEVVQRIILSLDPPINLCRSFLVRFVLGEFSRVDAGVSAPPLTSRAACP